MQSILKKLSLLDWLIASATLAYGAYSRSLLFIIIGLVSVAVAWYNPAKRMQARLLRSSRATRAAAEKEAAAQAALDRVAEEHSYQLPTVDASRASGNLLKGPVRYGKVTPLRYARNVLVLGGTNLYINKMTVHYF